MKITLTGASGFIGCRLVARLLEDGHSLHVLGRKRGGLPQSVDFSVWDVSAGEPLLESVEDVGAVIHLAGEHYHYGWTAEELLRQHPDLRPEEVYSALAYFYYHYDELVPKLTAVPVDGREPSLSRAELMRRRAAKGA